LPQQIDKSDHRLRACHPLLLIGIHASLLGHERIVLISGEAPAWDRIREPHRVVLRPFYSPASRRRRGPWLCGPGFGRMPLLSTAVGLRYGAVLGSSRVRRCRRRSWRRLTSSRGAHTAPVSSRGPCGALAAVEQVAAVSDQLLGKCDQDTSIRAELRPVLLRREQGAIAPSRPPSC
jgi:hypothetical protein